MDNYKRPCIALLKHGSNGGFLKKPLFYQVFTESGRGSINPRLRHLLPLSNSSSVTINFRDPDYSAEKGGYHPVEIMLFRKGDTWQLSGVELPNKIEIEKKWEQDSTIAKLWKERYIKWETRYKCQGSI